MKKKIKLLRNWSGKLKDEVIELPIALGNLLIRLKIAIDFEEVFEDNKVTVADVSAIDIDIEFEKKTNLKKKK